MNIIQWHLTSDAPDYGELWSRCHVERFPFAANPSINAGEFSSEESLIITVGRNGALQNRDKHPCTCGNFRKTLRPAGASPDFEANCELPGACRDSNHRTVLAVPL